MQSKYGKLEVSDILAGKKAVSRESAKVAATVKETVQQRLKEPIKDATVSLCLDMYTDSDGSRRRHTSHGGTAGNVNECSQPQQKKN